ncbi:S-adenosyl-L-methionine-dependent methyltransferase [Delphinella strobiligena]|nr:S-adenosyl-L-methionine-dependent methyltransferase [Delphinella strobiligena]
MESQYQSAQCLYDNRAQIYDDSWHPSLARHLAKIANIKPGDKVLDLACGTGLVTFSAAATAGEKGHVTAVDVSIGMLERARAKRGAQGHTNVEFYQHDITRLDTLDALNNVSFNVISLASALVLLDHPDAAVKLWVTFLKPGGCLVLDVPSPHNLVTGLVFERIGRRLGVKIPYYRDWVKSSDSLRNVLEDAGLIVEVMEPVEQTGAEVEYIDVKDAGKLFDQEVSGLAYRELAADDTRDRARAMFSEELEKIAVDGKVKREDLVWVAVARRPT